MSARVELELILIIISAIILLLVVLAPAEPNELPAKEILAKIQNNSSIECNGKTIKGDLNLSTLKLPKYTKNLTFIQRCLHFPESAMIITSPITIRNSIILGDVDFSGATFHNRVEFYNTTFDGSTNLLGSQFNKTAIFAKSKFNKIAHFQGAYFLEDVTFEGSQFNETADFGISKFNKNANFRISRFRKFADFGGSAFYGLLTRFEGANFSGLANFAGSNFSGNRINFGESRFNETTNFGGSNFSGYFINFGKSQFNGVTDFGGSMFNTTSDFANLHFNGPVYFGGVKFNKDALFNNSVFREDSYFNGATFSRNADFSFSKFNGDSLFEDTTFHGTLFLARSQIKSFYPRWNNISKLAYDDEAYLFLIDNYKRIGWFEDADNCYYQYRKDRLWHAYTLSVPNNLWDIIKDIYMILHQFSDFLFWVLGGYGVKPEHPLVLSFIFIFLFGLLFRITKCIIPKEVGVSDHKCNNLNIYDALYFSAMIFLSGTKLFVDLPSYTIQPEKSAHTTAILRIMLGFERVAGALLFFLFLLATARIVIR